MQFLNEMFDGVEPVAAFVGGLMLAYGMIFEGVVVGKIVERILDFIGNLIKKAVCYFKNRKK